MGYDVYDYSQDKLPKFREIAKRFYADDAESYDIFMELIDEMLGVNEFGDGYNSERIMKSILTRIINIQSDVSVETELSPYESIDTVWGLLYGYDDIELKGLSYKDNNRIVKIEFGVYEDE